MPTCVTQLIVSVLLISISYVQRNSSAGAQVEAAKYGLQLLVKSHRMIAKLRICIKKIDE